MNNLKIVFILAKPYIIKTIKSYCLLYLLFFGILISTFPVSWNGENLTFFQIPLEVYRGSREQALISILHEFFSWSWIFLAFYVLLINKHNAQLIMGVSLMTAVLGGTGLLISLRTSNEDQTNVDLREDQTNVDLREDQTNVDL